MSMGEPDEAGSQGMRDRLLYPLDVGVPRQSGMKQYSEVG